MASRQTVLSLSFANLDKVKARAQKAGKDAVAAAQEVIEDESYLVLALAKKDTPVATSALKNSGKVEGSGLKWIVRFGGPLVRYAIPVHERSDLRHRVGKAFFLKDALDYVSKTVQAKVSAAVAAALRKS